MPRVLVTCHISFSSSKSSAPSLCSIMRKVLATKMQHSFCSSNFTVEWGTSMSREYPKKGKTSAADGGALSFTLHPSYFPRSSHFVQQKQQKLEVGFKSRRSRYQWQSVTPPKWLDSKQVETWGWCSSLNLRFVFCFKAYLKNKPLFQVCATGGDREERTAKVTSVS